MVGANSCLLPFGRNAASRGKKLRSLDSAALQRDALRGLAGAGSGSLFTRGDSAGARLKLHGLGIRRALARAGRRRISRGDSASVGAERLSGNDDNGDQWKYAEYG